MDCGLWDAGCCFAQQHYNRNAPAFELVSATNAETSGMIPDSELREALVTVQSSISRLAPVELGSRGRQERRQSGFGLFTLESCKFAL